MHNSNVTAASGTEALAACRDAAMSEAIDRHVAPHAVMRSTFDGYATGVDMITHSDPERGLLRVVDHRTDLPDEALGANLVTPWPPT